MLQLLALQRAAAAAAAHQYHQLLHQGAAAAAATISTRAASATAARRGAPSSPCSAPASDPARTIVTSAHADQAQPKRAETDAASAPTTSPTTTTTTTLGRPPRTFMSRRERVPAAPPTAAVDFAPYQLKVYLSNRYTYASILHKASPSDPGTFVASASTLAERAGRGRRETSFGGGGEGEEGVDERGQPPAASAVSLCDSAAAARVGKALAERAAAAGLLSPPVPVQLSTRARKRAAGMAPRAGADPRAGAGTGRNPRRRFVGRLRALVEAAREAGLVVH
jgi:ribosomal protein L18